MSAKLRCNNLRSKKACKHFTGDRLRFRERNDRKVA